MRRLGDAAVMGGEGGTNEEEGGLGSALDLFVKFVPHHHPTAGGSNGAGAGAGAGGSNGGGGGDHLADAAGKPAKDALSDASDSPGDNGACLVLSTLSLHRVETQKGRTYVIEAHKASISMRFDHSDKNKIL